MNQGRKDNGRGIGDRSDKSLEALYRQASQVEPDDGLDRIIRARAEQAARAGQSPRRVPWLGGLVTASVAVVAIAVVLQQAPPGSPGTETLAPAEEAESKAVESRSFMAPSVGADATLESSSSVETRRSRSEIRRMQEPGELTASRSAPEAPSPPPGALEDRSDFASGDAGSDNDRANSAQRFAERADDLAADQAGENAELESSPTRSSEIDAEPATEFSTEAGAMLSGIKALIEQGESERALEMLEAFKRRYPRQEVPEEIEAALRPDAASN